MNKRGQDLINENVVFTIIVVVFIVALFIFISRSGSQATLYEQTYAKEIALIIDRAEVGMEIELEMFDAFKLARKNNFEGRIVNIDNGANQVNIRLYDAKGYDFYYFNDIDVVWDLDVDNRLLILKFAENVDV
ncbi:hypothetical protein CMI38_01110 [Candidatus Pacearchaeota archaeon]|jgi:hypothetical protein|nr:hypothetical protein [Candidatus Pacearchaeota archaeon]|tara:strand:- start:200 stop:598 length:399 start_codon:yes stop_codon:yes gene_type:complete